MKRTEKADLLFDLNMFNPPHISFSPEHNFKNFPNDKITSMQEEKQKMTWVSYSSLSVISAEWNFA